MFRDLISGPVLIHLFREFNRSLTDSSAVVSKAPTSVTYLSFLLLQTKVVLTTKSAGYLPMAWAISVESRVVAFLYID